MKERHVLILMEQGWWWDPPEPWVGRVLTEVAVGGHWPRGNIGANNTNPLEMPPHPKPPHWKLHLLLPLEA